MPTAVSEAIRRAIIDELRAENVNWSGGLGDIEFLRRIWDLEDMPSTDSRFTNAASDVHQHRYNNDDWPDDWLYDDPRFDLYHCGTDTFLKFLVEMVQPAVRRDPDEAEKLVRFFNSCLEPSGLEITTVGHQPSFAGRKRPTWGVRDIRRRQQRIDLLKFERLSDPIVLEQHLRRIDAGIELDPALAIAAAKELIESACKQVLDDFSEPYTNHDDLPELYRKVALVLRLNADSVPDSLRGSRAAQRALRALVTTVQSLAELRNELGLGHGRNRPSPALARHARLAATTARALVEFMMETWDVRRAKDPQP